MPETKIFIQLQEGIPLEIPEPQLDEMIAKAIFRSGQFDFQFPSFANERRYVLCAKDIVGYLPVGRNCIIQIAPKVPVLNLFRMLEVAYDLQSFRFLDGIIRVENLADLFERLASILIKRILLRLRKGLFRDYITHTHDLSFVRGRLLPKTLEMRFTGRALARCEYQEQTTDLEDNQILLWTLRALSGMEISRPDLHFKIRQAYRLLSNTVTLTPISPEMCSERQYHRLNQDYQAMHGICRFFLKHSGPGIHPGKSEMIPFLVNMPRLFEAFVAEWLQSNMPIFYRVGKQHLAKLRASEPRTWKMDVLISEAQSGKPIAVLDTKYKTGETIGDSDIQQVVAYATEMGVQKAFLIYPSRTAWHGEIQVGQVQVESVSFDIAESYDDAGKAFLAALTNKLKASVRTDPANI